MKNASASCSEAEAFFAFVTHRVPVSFTTFFRGTHEKALILLQLWRPLSCRPSGGPESGRSTSGWPARRRLSGRWWRRSRGERRRRGRRKRSQGCDKNRWLGLILNRTAVSCVKRSWHCWTIMWQDVLCKIISLVLYVFSCPTEACRVVKL